MNIKDVNINELKEYENNPRHNEAAVDKVVESIKEFGFKVPIIIDQNNVIVTGHTRIKAALRTKAQMNNRKVVKVHQNVLVFYKGELNNISKFFKKLNENEDISYE